jgi:subtilisin family serine protease
MNIKYISIVLLANIFLGCGNYSDPIIRSQNKDIVSQDSKSSSIDKKEPLFQEQWAYHYDKPFYSAYNIDKDAHIHFGKYANKYSGKGVKVAIIDAGLDVSHEEFKNNIIKTYNARDKSSDVKSDDITTGYHGTAVTGIIASNINAKGLKGFAPDSKIIFIKLDLNGFLDDEDFLDAFELAQNAGADIINCSWGTGDVSEVVKMKIDELATNGRKGKGIVVVFASGNDGEELENDESTLDSVIGVGSTDEENLRAIYSNFGEKIDILAPGGYELGITTTYPHNRYIEAESAEPFMGTSASTPIVTSLVSLLLEANPNLTRTQIQSIISLGADKIGNVKYLDGKNIYYGNGKVNFEKSIKLAETLKNKP